MTTVSAVEETNPAGSSPDHRDPGPRVSRQGSLIVTESEDDRHRCPVIGLWPSAELSWLCGAFALPLFVLVDVPRINYSVIRRAAQLLRARALSALSAPGAWGAS